MATTLRQSECELITLAARSSAESSGGDGEQLAALATDARLEDVLASIHARALLKPFAHAAGNALSAQQQEIDLSLASGTAVQLPQGCHAEAQEEREQAQLAVLSVAVAALHAFVQENWTGPDVRLSSAQAVRSAAPDAFPPRSVDADEDTVESQLNALVRSASLEGLTWAGEPAYHLCREPFYLLFAIKILDALSSVASPNQSGLASVAWWRLRAATVHSHVLDEPVPYGPSIMQPVDALLDGLKAAAQQPSTSSSALIPQHLHSLLTLERGLSIQRMGRDKEASEQFVHAAKAHNLLYQLSGALGKRTKFQKEDRTQLILLAESEAKSFDAQDYERSKAEEKAKAEGIEKAEKPEDPSQENPANWGWQTAPNPEQDPNMPSTFLLNDDTLLEQTAFTSTASQDSKSALSHIDPNNQPALFPLDQCILLALSLSIRNTSPTHGLTASEISAFVSRVLPHPQNWSVHTMALLLRSRLESSRTRTVERSVLQLQALIDQMPTSDSSAKERLKYFHSLELPSRWEMQSELAKRYASIGVTRSALEIFERVELWEEVVQCLGSLGRQEEGIEVIRDLLAGKKVEADVDIKRRRKGAAALDSVRAERMAYSREAKLWCLLGDIEPLKCKEHYEQAWETSRRSSARAARSLGGYYFARQQYVECARWLKAALKTNPLYSRSWFVLGCALMRTEQWGDAAIAFARCVAIVDDDGESWNNLASCYLRMGEDAARRLEQVEANGGDVPFLEEDGDDDARSEQSFGTDSAVDLADAAAHDPELQRVASSTADPAQRRAATPYRLRLLAHKALQNSVKYSRDSWRVWVNYMVVSVDAGLLGEACRAFARVVELRTAGAKNEQEKVEAVDFEVLDRLVDAVTRAPSDEEDAVDGGNSTAQPAYSPHEGIGLRVAVENLFDNVLLTRISSSTRIWRTYAKLQMWKRNYASCIKAHMEAYQHGTGNASDDSVLSDKRHWLEGLEDLEDLVSVMENLGSRTMPGPEGEADGKEVMPDWKFKARSVVRLFMGRSKELYGEEDEWERLVELRDRLK
ncbi:unnamed protein product [Tilletia laevis]|uniref:Uncharacterized protein n=2 Tax=Tilletia TaxID=13289 RepID=A0A177VHW8_9BASI|nr:hypothetical protein CF336_g1019 [Tilletia laevis]KAE8264035.1 hypothetical protein A4X03_0g1241 [Tilletia caries]KAE8208074.1 hypothetical protein CF335_g679 [Tilletia laevis]CAD6887136.1 unnamed protein product [Tilletia caries]CAD6902949.1 unnamed protein product [Tilletia caries]